MPIPDALNDREHRKFRQDPNNENQTLIGVTNPDLSNVADGFEIGTYDYIALTYVTSGNGVGEVETVTFKSGGASGTTVATLTITYDLNSDVSSVTKT